MLKITVLILLFSSLPAFAITFAGEGCQEQLTSAPAVTARKYPVATFVGIDELAALLEQHRVELPPSDLRPGVVMSDRERARHRNLKAVFPALINRKLKFQISHDDGSNGHLLGAIRKIFQEDGRTMVTLSIEGFGRVREPQEITIRADWITALNGVNHAMPVKATRLNIESVRALRSPESSLLGKQVRLFGSTGILIAAGLEVEGLKLKTYVLESIDGQKHWAEATTDEAPTYSVD